MNQSIKTNSNGEIIKTSFSTISRKDVSVQPHGDAKVIVCDFVNTYIAGPSGEKEDYRVVKKPKKTDEYDLKKVIHERCKGQDLKSIIARVEKTGDVSLLNQRQAAYGDGRLYPRNLGDALDKGRVSANFLDKLSASEKEQLIKMAKDPKEFERYVSSKVKEKQNQKIPVAAPVKSEVETEKGESK